jgi:hypothetical protein
MQYGLRHSVEKKEYRRAKVYRNAKSAAKFLVECSDKNAYVRTADCQGTVRYIVHWLGEARINKKRED